MSRVTFLAYLLGYLQATCVFVEHCRIIYKRSFRHPWKKTAITRKFGFTVLFLQLLKIPTYNLCICWAIRRLLYIFVGYYFIVRKRFSRHPWKKAMKTKNAKAQRSRARMVPVETMSSLERTPGRWKAAVRLKIHQRMELCLLEAVSCASAVVTLWRTKQPSESTC